MGGVSLNQARVVSTKLNGSAGVSKIDLEKERDLRLSLDRVPIYLPLVGLKSPIVLNYLLSGM
jgi:hypothetical protein